MTDCRCLHRNKLNYFPAKRRLSTKPVQGPSFLDRRMAEEKFRTDIFRQSNPIRPKSPEMQIENFWSIPDFTDKFLEH